MGIIDVGVLHDIDRRFQLGDFVPNIFLSVYFVFEQYLGHLLDVFHSTSGVFDLLLEVPELCIENFLLDEIFCSF